MAALIIALAGLFYFGVQSGYLVQNNAGAFYSYYSPDDLARENEKKTLEGAGEMRRNLEAQEALWALEDFYLTEAKRHLNRREFLVSLNLLHACCENRIMERYFSAYLDFTHNRWSAETRKKYMKKLRIPENFFYRSDVLDTLVVSPGKRTIFLWTLVLVLCTASASIWLFGRERKKR